MHAVNHTALITLVTQPLAVMLLLFASPARDGAARGLGPEGHDSASLAAAIRQAASGDTVRLPAGTFTIPEPVLLKSGLKLIGAGQESEAEITEAYRLLCLVEQHTDDQAIEVACNTRVSWDAYCVGA